MMWKPKGMYGSDLDHKDLSWITYCVYWEYRLIRTRARGISFLC